MLSMQSGRTMKEDDLQFAAADALSYSLPLYDPKTHYLEVARSGYFRALVVLRHYVKAASDHYFGVDQGAKNVDLFMLTKSVSSPMGPGSDSEALPIQFGGAASNLVDSSQFGFEPLLLNGFDVVYCYLPSMRGENPDKRHLNQFYHCEAELRGDVGKAMSMAEGYIKALSSTLLGLPSILGKISRDGEKTVAGLQRIIDLTSFPVISFDDAVSALTDSGNADLVVTTDSGRDISSQGELKLAEVLGFRTPFWVRSYDRDRVPFYQKPVPGDSGRVLNADLLFPPLAEGAFGGEIVGCGQRQDDPEEMMASIRRQGIDPGPYEWYINLRRVPGYQMTSGFGLGIERFITWALCHDDIKDAILYPRLKNVESYP